jgi:hypothetical protein
MKLSLKPHKSIGPILLGAKRQDVRSSLSAAGLPLQVERKRLDFFALSCIQVEYEEDDTASFIGVASDKNIELIYYGTDLFDIDAEISFRHIAEHESNQNHDFTDLEYIFPDQIISLWEADTQYDRKGGERRMVWGQIGIGDDRYLAAIPKIKTPNQAVDSTATRATPPASSLRSGQESRHGQP